MKDEGPSRLTENCVEDSGVKQLRIILPSFPRAPDATQHVSGEPLHESPEKPLCEAMKIKPGLQCGFQDAGDARVRIKRMVPVQERDVCVSSKAGLVEPSKPLDIHWTWSDRSCFTCLC